MSEGFASKEQVLAFERNIDATVSEIALPGQDYSSSLYHALTVFEDRPRWLLMSRDEKVPLVTDEPLFTQVICFLDETKFALRYLLERLWNRSKPPRRAPAALAVDGNQYRATADAFDVFTQYHVAAHTFTGYHTGHWKCKISPDARAVEFIPDRREDGFDALTYCSSTPEHPTPFLEWMIWIWITENRPAVIASIIDSVRVGKGDRISYRFLPDLCKVLSLDIHYLETNIPEDWVFPWGNALTVNRLIAALHLRCAYHLCAIHFGAEHHKIQGGGVDDLCLVTSRGNLVQELAQISDIPIPIVLRFVSILIYGHGTTSPDPSLQPLIPFGGSLVAVPCALIGSSRSGRNLLALHARLDSKSFDSQSALFEKEMLRRLGAAFRSRFRRTRVQVSLPNNCGGEEIDLLAIDPQSRTILVVEARSTIAPADPSEVYRRLSDIPRKVNQLARKLEAVRLHGDDILRWAEIENDIAKNWSIVGVVILAGHAGVLSDVPEIPIVPEFIALLGITSITSLRRFHDWLLSKKWLPQNGRHFRSVRTSHKIGEFEIRFGGINDIKTVDYLKNHLPKTIEEFSQ